MVVEAEGLSKSYGATRALEEVSLRIEPGGIVGLLGPNGAGKTTLLEIMEGLRLPSSGRVSVLGMDPTRQARRLRERIGVQLQSTAILPELTPLETVQLFSAFFRRSLPAREVLGSLMLADRAGVRNRALSGGYRQRLALAVALVNDPELVILDEPTSGLDAAARRDLHVHIASLRTSRRTVLLSTHYIEEAEKLCDRVIVLRAGRIVADGSPAQLIAGASGAPALSIVLAGTFDAEPLLRAGAVRAGRDGDRQRFTASDARAVIPALGALLQGSGAVLADLQMKRPTLEDVYLRLVGPPQDGEGEVA